MANATTTLLYNMTTFFETSTTLNTEQKEELSLVEWAILFVVVVVCMTIVASFWTPVYVEMVYLQIRLQFCGVITSSTIKDKYDMVKDHRFCVVIKYQPKNSKYFGIWATIDAEIGDENDDNAKLYKEAKIDQQIKIKYDPKYITSVTLISKPKYTKSMFLDDCVIHFGGIIPTILIPFGWYFLFESVTHFNIDQVIGLIIVIFILIIHIIIVVLVFARCINSIYELKTFFCVDARTWFKYRDIDEYIKMHNENEIYLMEERAKYKEEAIELAETMDARKAWKVGDSCLIYSESGNTWYNGKIHDIDDEDCLLVKYDNRSKTISKFDVWVKPVNNE